MARRWFLVLMLVSDCRRRPAPEVVTLSAHGARVVAVMRDGTVRAWGKDQGRAVLKPTVVDGLRDVTSACAGDDFLCALSKGGEVSCRGLEARAVGGRALACADHAVCVLAGDQVACGSSSLESLAESTGAVALAAAGETVCAVFADGSAKCWSSDRRPVSLGVTDAQGITVGPHHVCVLLRNETVSCEGDNDNGELGTGDDRPSVTLRAVSGVDIAKQVSAGAHHTCARMGDSTVHCWGKNDVHQAGVTNKPALFDQTIVTGLYEANEVAAGDDFTCVRMRDGWVRCLGVNDWGQLGDGTTDIRQVPTPIKY